MRSRNTEPPSPVPATSSTKSDSQVNALKLIRSSNFKEVLALLLINIGLAAMIFGLLRFITIV